MVKAENKPRRRASGKTKTVAYDVSERLRPSCSCQSRETACDGPLLLSGLVLSR